MVATAVAAPAQAARHPKHTAPLASRVTSFDECVAFRESSLTNANTGNGYYGYYQWLPSTWVYAQGVARAWFGWSPLDATFAQQTLVFNRFEPVDPGAWPVTVPACGG